MLWFKYSSWICNVTLINLDLHTNSHLWLVASETALVEMTDWDSTIETKLNDFSTSLFRTLLIVGKTSHFYFSGRYFGNWNLWWGLTAKGQLLFQNRWVTFISRGKGEWGVLQVSFYLSDEVADLSLWHPLLLFPSSGHTGVTCIFHFSTEGAPKANIKYSLTVSVGGGFWGGFLMSLYAY